MNRKVLGALGALAVSLAMVPEAAAEFSIKMGTRWEPLRYTFAARSSCPATGAVAGCGGMGGIGGYDSGLGGWQNLDLNPYVGLGFTDRFSINISLDFGTYSDSVLLNPPIREVLDTASYWQLGFKIGMKLYLSIPKREQIAAYIWLDAFKYVAGVHDPSRTVTDPADRFSAALRSPLGFDVGFGMEYFFNKFFSIGAEIIGLRYSYVRAYDAAGTGVGFLNCFPGDCNTTVENRSYITMYTLFTMNFHIFGLLEIRAKVYTKDDEGDAPKPAPKPAPKDDDDDDDGDDGDDGDDDSGDE